MTMETLKLEHIAPYLPYGLKLKTKNGSTIYTLSIGELSISDINDSIRFQHKPIFHPLSDLTNPIQHNGEEFVPYEEAPMSTHDIHCAQGITFGIGQVPYHIICKLFEWHFNVFNLPDHLWIDVNTIDNPYK